MAYLRAIIIGAIFLSLPLMAQAPSQAVRDFMAQCSQDRLTVGQLSEQLQAAGCLKAVRAKGDELVKAWQDFDKAKGTAKPDGETYVHAVGQKVIEYQAAEKSCLH